MADSSNLLDLIKKRTADFSKERGVLSCAQNQEEQAVAILNKVYNIVTVLRRHAGSVQIKYGGK